MGGVLECDGCIRFSSKGCTRADMQPGPATRREPRSPITNQFIGMYCAVTTNIDGGARDGWSGVTTKAC